MKRSTTVWTYTVYDYVLRPARLEQLLTYDDEGNTLLGSLLAPVPVGLFGLSALSLVMFVGASLVEAIADVALPRESETYLLLRCMLEPVNFAGLWVAVVALVLASISEPAIRRFKGPAGKGDDQE